MSAPFALRVARSDDLERLHGILAERSRWLRERGVPQWSTPYPIERYRDEIARGVVRVAVGTGGEALGVVTVSPCGPGIVWFSRLATPVEVGSLGVGRKILDAALAEVAAVGVARARLDCVAENPRLVRYYLDAGWSPLGTTLARSERLVVLERLLR